MTSRCTAAALVAALASLAPAPAGAVITSQRASGSFETQAGELSLSLGASVGRVEGMASELVFDEVLGRKVKLSELTWDIKGVLMAGVKASAGLGGRVSANLAYWTALSEGNGRMIDRDWMYPEEILARIEPGSGNWTHESRHPDTTLDKGSMLDLNLTVRAWQSGPFSVSGIVGFKKDDWKWSSRGGTATYSVEGFRDTEFEFKDGLGRDLLVIEYEQEYTFPYIGLGAGWSGESFSVDGRLLASTLVTASDTDNHVLRETIFKGDFSGGTVFGAGVGAAWRFSPRWIATAALDYQAISEITGDVAMRTAEGTVVFSDGGGIAQDSLLLSLGAGFAF